MTQGISKIYVRFSYNLGTGVCGKGGPEQRPWVLHGGEIEWTPWTKLEAGEIFVYSSRTWLGNNCQFLLLIEELVLKNQNSQAALYATGWPDLRER